MQRRRTYLEIPRDRATALGQAAVETAKRGWYLSPAGERVELAHLVETAYAGKVSIPPTAGLPEHEVASCQESTVQVTNETTLGAAKRLVDAGMRHLLALNFANGATRVEDFSRVRERRKSQFVALALFTAR